MGNIVQKIIGGPVSIVAGLLNLAGYNPKWTMEGYFADLIDQEIDDMERKAKDRHIREMKQMYRQNQPEYIAGILSKRELRKNLAKKIEQNENALFNEAAGTGDFVVFVIKDLCEDAQTKELSNRRVKLDSTNADRLAGLFMDAARRVPEQHLSDLERVMVENGPTISQLIGDNVSALARISEAKRTIQHRHS
jgi:hypothetical protein